jgi:hypothetical protein
MPLPLTHFHAHLHTSSRATSVPALAGFCGFRPIDAGPDIELVYALTARRRATRSGQVHDE